MEFKKLTLSEGLFAVIVISFILVAMTFSSAYYNDNYKISFEFQIYSLSAFLLAFTIMLMIIMVYFKINSFKELAIVVNSKSALDVLILVNCNILFFVLAFLFDNYMHHKNWSESLEFIGLLLLVSFLTGNLVAVFSVAFINFESPKFFSIGSINLQNAFGFLYYIFWIFLFFILSFILVYEGYPLISLSMLIFALIKVNLLSHCSY